MADKLDDLLASIQQHVAARRAELTATETQLGALQSAHTELQAKVKDEQAALQKAREDWAKAKQWREQIVSEVKSLAADIVKKASDLRDKTRRPNLLSIFMRMETTFSRGSRAR